MKIQLTYEEALVKHPTEVAAIIQRIRKSRSKNKNTDPATWSWSYDWGEMIPGASTFQSMFDEEDEPGLEPHHVKWGRLSLEERVSDVLPRCRGVHLSGHSQIEFVSSEVLRDYYTKVYLEQIEEEQRVTNLTPEQKERELQEALAWLMGPKNKGFMAIGVRK